MTSSQIEIRGRADTVKVAVSLANSKKKTLASEGGRYNIPVEFVAR